MRKIAIFLAVLFTTLPSLVPLNNEKADVPGEVKNIPMLVSENKETSKEVYISSAEVEKKVESGKRDLRPVKLEKFLSSKGSPLSLYAEFIVEAADRYGIDWRLVPAISGIESSFAQVYAADYNAYGWGGGYISFSSWEESIEVVTRALRENYYDRGADTVDEIAPIYCPPNYVKWTGAVNKFMENIENTSTKADLGSSASVLTL